MLPLEGKLKLALAPVLVGVGEATFWIGGLFVGKELVTLQTLRNPRTGVYVGATALRPNRLGWRLSWRLI